MTKELDRRTEIQKAIQSILDGLGKEFGQETFVTSGYGYYDEATHRFMRLIEEIRFRGSGFRAYHIENIT